jgi:hypothetical protein
MLSPPWFKKIVCKKSLLARKVPRGAASEQQQRTSFAPGSRSREGDRPRALGKCFLPPGDAVFAVSYRR